MRASLWRLLTYALYKIIPSLFLQTRTRKIQYTRTYIHKYTNKNILLLCPFVIFINIPAFFLLKSSKELHRLRLNRNTFVFVWNFATKYIDNFHIYPIILILMVKEKKKTIFMSLRKYQTVLYKSFTYY